MRILINTDKTMEGDEKHQLLITDQIQKAVHIHESHITKIEVHLSDQNGKKDGWGDILCLLEAKIEDRPPVVVSDQADTKEIALAGAIDKLKGALENILGRLQDHHK